MPLSNGRNLQKYYLNYNISLLLLYINHIFSLKKSHSGFAGHSAITSLSGLSEVIKLSPLGMFRCRCQQPIEVHMYTEQWFKGLIE